MILIWYDIKTKLIDIGDRWQKSTFIAALFTFPRKQKFKGIPPPGPPIVICMSVPLDAYVVGYKFPTIQPYSIVYPAILFAKKELFAQKRWQLPSMLGCSSTTFSAQLTACLRYLVHHFKAEPTETAVFYSRRTSSFPHFFNSEVRICWNDASKFSSISSSQSTFCCVSNAKLKISAIVGRMPESLPTILPS
jgi:hypothetical protein